MVEQDRPFCIFAVTDPCVPKAFGITRQRNWRGVAELATIRGAASSITRVARSLGDFGYGDREGVSFLAVILLCLSFNSSMVLAQERGASDSVRQYEDSPFGFHPATAPGGDPYRYAKDIGVRWDRAGLYFMWVLVQTDSEKKEYDWRRYDREIRRVPEGIWCMKNITTAHANIINRRIPPGRRKEVERLELDKRFKKRSYLPKDEKAYMDFVTACIERYDGDGKEDMPGLKTPIKYWQVANEPPRGLSDYPRLVEITNKAIKRADADAKVMIGGVPGFPQGYIEGFRRRFLPILRELNGKCVDIFDFHWYGNATGDYQFDKAYEYIKTELANCGFGDIPIWITEMGSYSGEPRRRFRGKMPYQSEAQQAADLLKRYVYSLSKGIKKIFWAWGLVEGFKYDDGYFDHTGLIYDGRFGHDKGRGVRKLAYYTHKLMTEKLEGSDWSTVETLIDGKDNVYLFKFKKKDARKEVYVAWWDHFDDTGSSKTVAFNVDFSGNALITRAVPNAKSGAELKKSDYPDFFETQTKPAINGEVSMTLGQSPVFVEQE